MNGLYQDVIIMLTIFFVGTWGIYYYYKLRHEFNELRKDFHRLAEGREYANDIDQQAFAQGRKSSADIPKMQEDIINLMQSCTNLNAKINRNNKWTVETVAEITDVLKNVTDKLHTIEALSTVSALSKISVQDVLDAEND